MARKSKYETHIKPHLEKIRQWKQNGATDEQIFTQLGVSHTTYYDAIKKHPELSEVVSTAKTSFIMDLRGELARLAFKHELDTIKIYTKEDKATGTKTEYVEKTTKEVDGDIAAINLLLKNLDRDNWSNDPQQTLLKQQEFELKKAIAKSTNFDLELSELESLKGKIEKSDDE